MSFSTDLKREIAELKLSGKGRRARLKGMLLYSKEADKKDVLFSSSHAFLCETLQRDCAHLLPEASVQLEQEQRGRKVNYLVTAPEQQKAALLAMLGADDRFYQEPALGELLGGIFLACGTMTDPKKAYLLEFSCRSNRRADALCELLRERGIFATATTRQGQPLVYVKDSESVEDTVTLMGAVKTSFEIMNIKIYKDIRNKANRITNCETANIEKTVAAAARQTQAIHFLISEKGEDFLTPELKQAAQLRLDNPEASLSELLAAADFPVSRSGLNHRLNRLCLLADRLKEKH